MILWILHKHTFFGRLIYSGEQKMGLRDHNKAFRRIGEGKLVRLVITECLGLFGNHGINGPVKDLRLLDSPIDRIQRGGQMNVSIQT